MHCRCRLRGQNGASFCRRKNPVIGKRLYLAMWTIEEDSQRSPIIILFEVIVINNDSDPIELLRLLTIFIPFLIYLLFVDSPFFFDLSTVSFHFTHQKPFLARLSFLNNCFFFLLILACHFSLQLFRLYFKALSKYYQNSDTYL